MPAPPTQRKLPLIQPDKISNGHCGAAPSGGDCVRADSGSWSLNLDELRDWDKARDVCVLHCNNCARCKYISYSLPQRICIWYSACNMAKLKSESGFRSLELAPQLEHVHVNPGREKCFLDWHPFNWDRGKGMNHQLASLSCALGEAHFAKRTLVLPTGGFCQRQAGVHDDAHDDNATLVCIPWSELLDLKLLSRLSPVVEAKDVPAGLSPVEDGRDPASGQLLVEPCRMTAKGGCRHPLRADVGNFSSPSMKAVSCQAVPYLRRSVGTHWFSPCFWHRTHSASLLRAAWRAIAGSRLGLQTSSSERRPAIEGAWISSILNLLRSGLWFSAKIKQAAAEARALIGSDDYVTLHLRRGDRLTPPMCSKSMQSKSACWRFDNLTRPPAIREALAQWVSNSTTIYVASADEPAAFFAPLQADYRLRFVHDIEPVLRSHAITGTSQTYAVEQLLMFGSRAMIETFDSYARPTREACFPAAASLGRHAVGASAEVTVSCRESETVVVNGVLFGPACTRVQSCSGLQLTRVRASRKSAGSSRECDELSHQSKLQTVQCTSTP